MTDVPESPPNGVLTTVAPAIRRLIAPNPSVFTFTGTCSYIIGESELAILDPGPDDDTHLTRLIEAVAGARVLFVVITHTHRDHSPLAARLATATGAKIVGASPHFPRPGAPQGLDASHDLAYAPDRVLADGESVAFGDHALTAIATPGHAANHLSFSFGDALFSGDHVMAWSTSVVAPPDGSMSDYMASLEKLRGRDEAVYWPGHGGPVTDPKRYVRGLITHRRQRETAILARLDAGPSTIAEIVEKNYVGLAPGLKGAAALSTLAHMEDLLARGLTKRGEGAPLEAVYVRQR
jgi:glyoxylase-like metal-dependent hydrolase (beta-lactamase superfamily II)